MKKKSIILILLLSLLLSLTSCGNKEEEKVSQSGFYFDTLITITLYDCSDQTKIDDCFALAKQYESLLSNTIENSDISKINNNPGQFVTVDDITISVLKEALKYCELSNGSFDITIGKLADLWNISEVSQTIESEDHQVTEDYIPSDTEIQTLLKDVDYQSIEIKGNQVRLNNENCKIDLGAIAKGYIADLMKQELNEAGVKKGIINLGGNILTIGPKDDDQTYCIGIQKPFDQSGEVIQALYIKDASVVTSGIYERYFKVGSQIYHHILDTSTGYPLETNLYSVTIISDSSCQGDALSTLVFTLGLDKGKEFIEGTEGVEAVFVKDDYTIDYTSGASAYFDN